MNTYQLDDKVMDQKFLSGETVKCKAVIREQETDQYKAGTRIVVLLSTGKKYMGEVTDFTWQLQRGYAEGMLTLIRFPRLNK
jgi:hypothetical protein